MPSTSKSQQRLMGMAHAEQKGHDTGSAKAKEVAATMDPGDVTDFAETSHESLPEQKGSEKKSEAVQLAFVQSFFNKCASLGASPPQVTKMVYAICNRESDARDAFDTFLKQAMDLSTLPKATTPSVAPNRGVESEAKPCEPEAEPTPEISRAREIMQKKYASTGWSLEQFLAMPMTTVG